MPKAGRTGLLISIQQQGVSELVLAVKKVRCGYILVNRRTGAHAHFANYAGACMVLDWIRRGKLPRKPWLQESARRVCTEKQFAGLR